jgi:hypothetical protein
MNLGSGNGSNSILASLCDLDNERGDGSAWCRDFSIEIVARGAVADIANVGEYGVGLVPNDLCDFTEQASGSFLPGAR